MLIYTDVYSFTPVSTRKKHIHRGQLLANVVKDSGLNKTALARKAGYSRSSYYKHIEDPDLGYHILFAYGKALKHDFTEDLPEMPKYLMEEPEEEYSQQVTLKEAIKQRDYWKDKFYELLDRYHKLREDSPDKRHADAKRN